MSSATPDPRRWIALGLLCATQFMLVIDVSIINVALPTIQRALHFSTANLQWVASGYALTFGGFLLLGGRAADLLGRRLMFMIGLFLFVAASLACGFASSSDLLIGARAVQGLGAAMVAPAALSILTTTFAEGIERNKALAAWGAVSGAGGAVGVLLGGVFTEYLGWEWVFYVNAPIGLLAITLAPRLLRESRVEDAARNFDAAGAVTVTAGLSLFVYTLVKTDSNHWLSATTLGLFAASALLLIVFVVIETRAAHPLLPLSIFRLRTLSGANVIGFLTGASLFSMFFLLALYMQSPGGLGYTPLRSGFGYLLIAISIVVSAGASQVIVSKVGVPKVLGAGLVMLIAGLLWFTQLSPHGSYLVDLAPGFLLAGLGLGFTFIPVTIAALEGISDRQAGLASGLINTSQQIGGALGVALLTTVLTNYTVAHNGPNAGPEVFTDGLSRAFLVGAALVVVAFLANLLLVRAAGPEPSVAESDEAVAASSA